MDVGAFASMHARASWVAIMMDVADWQPDAKSATYPSTSPLRVMDATGGHMEEATVKRTSLTRSRVFLNFYISL